MYDEACFALLGHHDEVPEGKVMKKILVVDDNAMNLRLIQDLLTVMGYTVITANSGTDAVHLALEQRFDLILMDVQMPGMSGTEAMRQLKRQPDWPEVPIVAITALAMEGDEQQLLEAGFDGYISKPIVFSDMLSSIAALLDSAS